MTAYTNVDTLPDLRPTIAELLDGLALYACADGRCMVEAAYQRGAETLRWSAEREAWTVEELEGQIEHLIDTIEKIEQIADRPGGGKIKEIREVVAKTWA